ncbi:MAG: Fpg/Nei family DNA glycosylase [Deltaproteobacteria bacterium]|nr:Fpg/Nei family DNA glycosylase [Deltaproteobacteria bacterium]
MPEGDTIYALAERLRPQVLGKVLTDVWLRDTPGASYLEGAEVVTVRAWGKHLLMDVRADGRPDRVFRTHLGMTGRWQTLRRPARRHPSVRVAFRAGPHGPELRCADAAQVEVFLARDLPRHPALARLGPDLLGAFDVDVVVSRARERDPVDLAALLLDQTIAAGLGNVFKCEVLFRAGLHPATPLAAVDDATIARLFEDGAALLEANKLRSRRVTTLGPTGARARVHGMDQFVYGRAGRPCVRCGGRIRVTRQGPRVRPTYWCPRCQPAAPSRDPNLPAVGSGL